MPEKTSEKKRILELERELAALRRRRFAEANARYHEEVRRAEVRIQMALCKIVLPCGAWSVRRSGKGVVVEAVGSAARLRVARIKPEPPQARILRLVP